MKRALCWLRRDLRLQDHAALHKACSSAEAVAVVFIFDRNILDKLQDPDDRRVTLIHDALLEIDAELQARGSMLVVRYGDPKVEIPAVAKAFGAEAVFAARDHEPYALERDGALGKELPLHLVKDQVILETQEVGQPYKVYSPYSRAWMRRLDTSVDLQDFEPDLSRVAPRNLAEDLCHAWSLGDMGFKRGTLPQPAGPSHAQKRLTAFRTKMRAYGEQRNFPATDGTSSLSPDLRFGTISIRACVREALAIGGDKWLSELVWRDFYQSILQTYPRVATSTFQPLYESLAWPGNLEHLMAWEEGQTGYPIVDAAMRCLKATGWMHNRLRMIVASFLTKDLLLDYRLGEAHFARYLLDFDLASNNGGWQWAAGTGCDAQPYFRVFNPALQSERFDAEGTFIRRWLPELAKLPARYIHVPHETPPMELEMAGVRLGADYPLPIVHHATQKERAIRLFKDHASTSV